jgi:hypothetical protein
MNRYIFKNGGEEPQDNFFNDYVSLLENASQQSDNETVEPPMVDGVDETEEDPFITNLQTYDEEQIAISRQERQDEVFNQYLAKIDERLSYLDSYAQESNLFEDIDETALTNNYDTRVNPTPFFSRQGTVASNSGSSQWNGIFRNEGAKTGQPTNLNSSAIGRGQMIKGTREAMYKKLGIKDIVGAEQKFKTDPNFEMQVMNAYREDLDKRIPSNITGQDREYMIAKGWYTGNPFFPDNVIPGKSAGNKMTAGEYARRAVGLK